MSSNKFETVVILRDHDDLGLIAPITVQRKGSGYTAYSFAIFKEFERRPGGQVQRTSYLNERHIGAARRLLDRIEQKIRAEQDKIYQGRGDQGAA